MQISCQLNIHWTGTWAYHTIRTQQKMPKKHVLAEHVSCDAKRSGCYEIKWVLKMTSCTGKSSWESDKALQSILVMYSVAWDRTVEHRKLQTRLQKLHVWKWAKYCNLPRVFIILHCLPVNWFYFFISKDYVVWGLLFTIFRNIAFYVWYPSSCIILLYKVSTE